MHIRARQAGIGFQKTPGFQRHAGGRTGAEQQGFKARHQRPIRTHQAIQCDRFTAAVLHIQADMFLQIGADLRPIDDAGNAELAEQGGVADARQL